MVEPKLNPRITTSTFWLNEMAYHGKQRMIATDWGIPYLYS
jgi:hypothetical protein